MKRPIIITLLVAALVLVLAGIGAVIFFSVRGNGGNFFTGRTQPFATVQESKTLQEDAKKTVTLKVIDDAGSVTVIGADVETVQVKVTKTAHASTQARAEEEVKTIEYDLQQVGNTVTLTYDLPNTIVFNLNLETVDFVVTVPRETTVDIGNNLGEVSVEGTKGNVVVKNDFGDVTVKNIEGPLSLATSSGEVTAISIMAGDEDIDLKSDFGGISLNKVNGNDIKLDTNSGTLTLNEVRATGDLTTNTDFGDMIFENSSADSFRVETNSGGVSLIKIKVNKEIFVKDDFGKIELEQAFAASYDLHTNSGSIVVDGARGNLKADTDFGDIDIKNAQSVTLEATTNSGTVEFSGSLGEGPHLIKSDFGSIDISLPADTKLTVDLKTDFGTINSDLPITITLNGRGSRADNDRISGSINGGGEQLTGQTNSGDIDIKVIN